MSVQTNQNYLEGIPIGPTVNTKCSVFIEFEKKIDLLLLTTDISVAMQVLSNEKFPVQFILIPLLTPQLKTSLEIICTIPREARDRAVRE